MVTLLQILGLILLLIGIGVLLWTLLDAIDGMFIETLIIKLIVGIALVIIGVWLLNGPRISLT
jgi:hypothetical protein